MGNSSYYIYKQLIAGISIWAYEMYLRREGTRSCSRNCMGFGSAGYYNLYIINKAGEPSFIVCGRSVGEEWTLSRICCWWVGFEGEGSCYKRVLLVAIEDQAVAVLVPCGGGLGEAAGGGRGGGDGH